MSNRIVQIDAIMDMKAETEKAILVYDGTTIRTKNPIGPGHIETLKKFWLAKSQMEFTIAGIPDSDGLVPVTLEAPEWFFMDKELL